MGHPTPDGRTSPQEAPALPQRCNASAHEAPSRVGPRVRWSMGPPPRRTCTMTERRTPEHDRTATDDRRRGRSATVLETERREERQPAKPEEKSPWLREGADAPDAADIEDPKRQR